MNKLAIDFNRMYELQEKYHKSALEDLNENSILYFHNRLDGAKHQKKTKDSATTDSALNEWDDFCYKSIPLAINLRDIENLYNVSPPFGMSRRAIIKKWDVLLLEVLEGPEPTEDKSEIIKKILDVEHFASMLMWVGHKPIEIRSAKIADQILRGKRQF